MKLFDNLFDKKKSKTEKITYIHTKPKADLASITAKVRIPCGKCNGYYKIREGKYGLFAGCSNYPSCTSTIKLPVFVLSFIERYGINIYCWKKECYKCRKKTAVYSYYLDYDLAELDEYFNMRFGVGLGDLSYVDELLSGQIATIQLRYSNTTKTKYMANICEHCGALQGRNYVVDDPHEIFGELYHDRGMEKFLFRKIEVKDTAPLVKNINDIYSGTIT